MEMLISELSLYDFLKDKLKLSDSDAKRYVKELALAEEKLYQNINNRFKEVDYITNNTFNLKMGQLEARVDARMEKGFKDIIIWVVGTMIAISGLAIAIMKLF